MTYHSSPLSQLNLIVFLLHFERHIHGIIDFGSG